MTIDPDVAAMLEEQRTRYGMSLKQAVNQALRAGLQRDLEPPPSQPYQTRSVDHGRALIADPEGLPILEEDIWWVSSLEGELGTGASIEARLDEDGEQEIEVCALDPEDSDLEGCDTITIDVIQD